MRFPTGVALVAVAAIAGCGGGGGNTMSTSEGPSDAIALRPVVQCLRKEVANGRVSTASGALDQIARKAGRGGVALRFDVSRAAPKGTNVVTVALERTIADAKTTELHYRSVYKALGGDPSGLLSRTGNAVIAFGARPSAQERAVVDRCVRPSR